MTTTSAAATRTSQTVAKVGHGNGAHSHKDPHGFGRILSATTHGAETKANRISRLGDDDGKSGELSANAEDMPDDPKMPEAATEARPTRNVDRALHKSDEADDEGATPETDDPRGTMFAPIPALTAAEPRKAERQPGKPSDHATAEKIDPRPAEHRIRQAAKPELDQETVKIKSDETKPGERMEAFVRRISSPQDREAPHALFAKTLQANLGAMPAEKPARLVANDGERKQNSKTDAGASPKSMLASTVATIETVASPEPRAERRGAMKPLAAGEEKRSETTSREAKAIEGRSPAGGDRTSLPQAPTAPLSTGNPIVQTVASTPAWATAVPRVAAVISAMPNAAAPVEALKIQLHPAELGMVTANLRIAGGQLSIEIDVDTPEAYLKLSSERDAISKALHASGMAIDKVTINPPPAHQPVAARDPNGAFTGGQDFARQDFQGSGAFGQSGNSGNANHGAAKHNRHDNEHIASTETRPGSDAAGGGVYI